MSLSKSNFPFSGCIHQLSAIAESRTVQEESDFDRSRERLLGRNIQGFQRLETIRLVYANDLFDLIFEKWITMAKVSTDQVRSCIYWITGETLHIFEIQQYGGNCKKYFRKLSVIFWQFLLTVIKAEVNGVIHDSNRIGRSRSGKFCHFHRMCSVFLLLHHRPAPNRVQDDDRQGNLRFCYFDSFIYPFF